MTARTAALVAAAFTAACSSQGSSDYSQLITYAQQAWSGEGKTITVQQASAVPYASIAVSVGDGPQQMLVLASESGQERLWTSSSHIVIATRAGRIVRTVGLPHDLSALGPGHGKSILPPSASMLGPTQQSLRADYRDTSHYSEAITCNARPAGPEQISILGQRIHTMRVNEDCTAPKLNWQFENSYWIDPNSGLVWRSVQHVAPGADTVEINTLRPPQQADLAAG